MLVSKHTAQATLKREQPTIYLDNNELFFKQFSYFCYFNKILVACLFHYLLLTSCFTKPRRIALQGEGSLLLLKTIGFVTLHFVKVSIPNEGIGFVKQGVSKSKA